MGKGYVHTASSRLGPHAPSHQVPGGITYQHASTQHPLTHPCTWPFAQSHSSVQPVPTDAWRRLPKDLLFVSCNQ